MPSLSISALIPFLVSSAALAGASPGAMATPAAPQAAAEDEALAPEERGELELMRRRGEGKDALADLDEILEELPRDYLSRALRSRLAYDAGDYAGAEADGRRALTEALEAGAPAADVAVCARSLAYVLVELGRAAEALLVLESAAEALDPAGDARDAWSLSQALLANGQREEAVAALEAGAGIRGQRSWTALLAQARCQRALGRMEQAATTLVAADEAARRDEGTEPDVLVELGQLYFEAYGEVDDAVSRAHSPAELYREALTLHAEHEGALLGLFELYRFNWRRSRSSPWEILGKLFSARPDSVRGLLARVSASLDDGDLKSARKGLARLEELAPGRRDVQAERATLLWIEHQREEALALLEELLGADPGDSAPEREVGRHLLELYRFAEGLPFLERAVERDRGDWQAWTQLGRAQANTGDEVSARESLSKAVEVAEGRRDAWRDNTALVLRRMDQSLVEYEGDDLSFVWLPDAAFVLRTYLEPFYVAAREELAERYGFTPDPVRIEVFRKWEDFSVRSTGFQGYPALGVCFGPVVTAVSPLSELRGNFSWARTSYHEFTHVVHLGLSHNRCPRWVTEGLATWEEGTKNPAWWRNMRRELVDARANGEILPIRRLNNAFRGPSVLFAYFQSGLLCKMLIEERGFPPMVRLLEAFDRGEDLDGAFREVFDLTPEELDERLLAYVDEELADLSIEPRWSPSVTFNLRFRLSRRPPEAEGEQAAWADDWCRVGWGNYWAGNHVDAEEALRLASAVGDLPPRGLFLRGELSLVRGDRDGAAAAFRQAFEEGGDDYRARMALAALSLDDRKLDDAIHHYEAARQAFPGYDDPRFSAELELARLFERQDDPDRAFEERLRWLDYNAGDYDNRIQVAGWLFDKGRFEESERYWREANEVDPFRRTLHHRWGLTLRELGRYEEALREFEVALVVPMELDADVPAALPGPSPEELERMDPREREMLEAQVEEVGGQRQKIVDSWLSLEPELLGLKALTLLDLERPEEARAEAERALERDPECEPALEVRERLL